MRKRALILMMIGVLGAVSLTGCGNSLSDNDVVATMGDIEINAKLYNFFARYQQAMYETYYSAYLGDDMWSQEASDDQTYEEYVKDNMLEEVETMLALEDHADEYDVALTDAEKEAIADLAQQFIDANDSEDLKLIDADEATVERALTLVAIQEKMYDAIIAGIDTDVSDEEAAQKNMQYVEFDLTTTDDDGNSTEMTDDEKAEVKKTAEAFAKGAAKASDFEKYAKKQDLTATTVTFDSEDTDPAEEVVAAADKMKDGEISDVIETDDAYYVVKLVSTFDEDATETEKEQIVSDRQSSHYQEVYEGWLGAYDIEKNDKVYEKISFEDPSVTMKDTSEDSEESTDESTESTDSTDSSATDNETDAAESAN